MQVRTWQGDSGGGAGERTVDSGQKIACKRYCKEKMKRMTADTLTEVVASELGVDGWKARVGIPMSVQQKQWWTDNFTNADTNTTQTAATSAAQLYYDSGESEEWLVTAELLSDTDDDY
jgi:hypothetical protein